MSKNLKKAQEAKILKSATKNQKHRNAAAQRWNNPVSVATQTDIFLV